MFWGEKRKGDWMKKVGIIGCGNIAQVHGWVLDKMDNVVLSAVCDTDNEKASGLAEKYGDESTKIFTDWHSLCREDLDVVHICTPHYLHTPMAVELLKQGKAVFMEKPCAVSKEQLKELKEADGQNPGRMGFCFQNRYNETTLAAEKMISEGIIGEVRGGRAFVTWKRDEGYYAGSEWKGIKEREGGGALINQSIHTLDLLLQFLGEPDRVEATVRNHHLQDFISVEDTVEAWLSFPGDKRACFYASNGYVTDAPVMLELQGETGRITISGPEITLWTETNGYQHFVYEQKAGIGKGYWGCGHEACIADYYRCLEESRTFAVNLCGVENTMKTIFEIYEKGEGKWNR